MDRGHVRKVLNENTRMIYRQINETLGLNA